MRARHALFGLLLLTVAACVRQDEAPPAAGPPAAGPPAAGPPAAGQPAADRPAADRPATAPNEDGVVAHASSTHGALEVKSVNDRPRDWFMVFQHGERALPGNPPLLDGVVELPPGAYEVEVNRTRRPVTLRAGEKVTVWTGELVVEGADRGAFWVPTQDGERRVAANPPVLNSALALFPGTYTVSVHVGVGVPEANLGEAEVVAGQRTVLRH